MSLQYPYGYTPHLEDFFSPFFQGWPYGGTGIGPEAGRTAGAGAGASAGAGAGAGAGEITAGGGTAAGAAPPYTRSIPVDFIERENEFILRADIPGVHKSEIRVSVDGNVVRFGHQPHPDREQKDEQESGIFHRAERVSSFRGRALRMPDNADCEQITAKYEDGVLELRIAKKKTEASRPEGRVVQVA